MGQISEINGVRKVKHELKTWPEYFQAVWCGDKNFEIRKDDRRFKERDEVVLQEFDPANGEYTGREIEGFIRYITTYEQKPGMVVFSFSESSRRES